LKGRLKKIVNKNKKKRNKIKMMPLKGHL